MTAGWVTGAPPSADWYVIVSVTGTPFLRLAAALKAFRPAAVGLIVKVTEPAAVTAFEPLPNLTFAGRHLPFSLNWPVLHFAARAANTPNRPFGNVASQWNLPGSATVTLTVMAPVLALKLACPPKLLFGGGRWTGGAGATAKDCEACDAA